MAHSYSLNLSDEVMKGMEEKARRGGVLGRAPYGYINAGAERPPDIKEEEASVVRLIFDKAVNSGLKPFAIARFLNSIGVKTGKNGEWSAAAIKYILSNPFYAGILIWNKHERGTMRLKNSDEWITAQGRHEPIIPANVFERAKELLSCDTLSKSPVRCQHWLSGLIKCSNCGKSLSISNINGPYPAFQCHAYNKGQCGVSHYLPVSAAETAVIASLNSFFRNPPEPMQYEKIHISENLETKKYLENRIKKSHEMLCRIKSAYISGADSLTEYIENKAAINNETAALKYELSLLDELCISQQNQVEVKEGVFTVTNTLCDKNITAEARNALLRRFIKKIIFVKEKKTLEVYYYTQ